MSRAFPERESTPMSEKEPRPLQIAIDGPVAAGKGDIAARLARELGLLYIYTGSMYRMLAFACDQAKVSTRDTDGVVQVLQRSTFELVPPEFHSALPYKAMLNGQDVSDEIFKHAQGASDVSLIPAVRKHMVQLQASLVGDKPVVMEGRDIAKRVLPEAQLKIYLDADVEVRARRRWNQLSPEDKVKKSFDNVLEDTKKRDTQDMSRSIDPLEVLPEHWVLDTTNMNQEQVIGAITQELKRRNLL